MPSKQRAFRDVDIALTGCAHLLTVFCVLLALHLALGESRRIKLEKENVTWNCLGRKTYTHKLRYELISVGKNEGALSVPRGGLGSCRRGVTGSSGRAETSLLIDIDGSCNGLKYRTDTPRKEA